MKEKHDFIVPFTSSFTFYDVIFVFDSLWLELCTLYEMTAKIYSSTCEYPGFWTRSLKRSSCSHCVLWILVENQLNINRFLGFLLFFTSWNFFFLIELWSSNEYNLVNSLKITKCEVTNCPLCSWLS